MKRKIIYASVFIFMVVAFGSCNSLKNCNVCSQNTYDSNQTLITAGSETEYCDADLVKIKATPPVTVLGVTTKWVCH
jgi:hypothetical protein